MKHHRLSRSFLGGLLSMGLLLGQAIPMVQASIPNAYWQYQTPFVTAKENNDYQNLITASLAIEKIMLPESPSSSRTQILRNVYEALAISYEALMDYDSAIAALEQQAIYAEALGFTDEVILANKRIIQIDPLTEVYALTQNLWQLPNYNALYEPAAGAYYGKTFSPSSGAPFEGESALSLYIECFDEEISAYNYFIAPYDTGEQIIQVCLNMPEEATSIAKVLNGGSDDYFYRLTDYLSQMNSPILLRIGGEMNVWSNSVSPEDFKAAFIKIVNIVRNQAPNVAIVFSPNDISEWGTSPMDFYPGDQYVDWVGMSAYTQKFLDPYNPYGSTDNSNMFYGAGDYADPIHALTEMVELFGDRKPILISESGAGYRHKDVDLNLYSFSISQLEKLFTYANMVYPQVKGIINFNANISTDKYYFAMRENPDLQDAYIATTAQNPTLLNSASHNLDTAYLNLGDYADNLPVLSLAAHSAPVGMPNITVAYRLDGVQVASSSNIPYTYDLPLSSLSQGIHDLTVTFSGDNGFYEEKYYQLNKKSGDELSVTESTTQVTPNFSTTPEPEVVPEPEPEVVPEPETNTTGGFSDVGAGQWFAPYVQFVTEEGIMTGYGSEFLPTTAANRGTVAQALAAISGENTTGYDNSFLDIADSPYEDAIGWAYYLGLLSGYDASTFGPDRDVSRQEFAAILYKFAVYQNQVDTEAKSDFANFNDSADISAWAQDAMAWAVAQGVITGSDGNLNPKGDIKRHEMSAMIYSFCQLSA